MTRLASNKRTVGRLASVAKPPGRYRPPAVTPNPPRQANRGRRVKVVDSNGRARMQWFPN